MATEITELERMAFELFKGRASITRRGSEMDARLAFKQAEAFLDVQERIRAGELTVAEPEGPQLANCCCPNLPRSHPHNLVARLHTDRQGVETPGDLAKVNRIKKWLDKNPTPEDEDEQRAFLNRFKREFSDLGWDVAQVGVARAVFPGYVKN